jgi:hypothetical protein
MDDIVLRISRHYITGITGLIGLGAATYFIKRYLSNNEKTTSTYYTRPDELVPGSSLASLSASRKIYIFWNGDFNSTYLLLDYLQQDYIVQPMYIERYTIRKALENDKLTLYTREYNQSRASGSKVCNTNVLEYLAAVAKMKRQQASEISQMTTLRRVITNQYPEFRNNLLPTRYITVIEKDLAHSQRVYDAIRELNLPTIEYSGIEMFEQASRYVAHLHLASSINDDNDDNDDNESIISKEKVVMGYSQDSHLTKIIKKIENKLQQSKSGLGSSNISSAIYKIDFPLANIPSNTIKYLASEKINKEVIRFLNS